MVERLTSDKEHDPFFVRSFLLTLHSFSSPSELIELLALRYTLSLSAMGEATNGSLIVVSYAIPPRLRSGRSKEEWELFKMTIRSKYGSFLYDKGMQIEADRFCRIWFVVKTWVESYWYDFEGVDALQVRLTTFLTDKLATDPHFTKPAHKLLYLISRKVSWPELQINSFDV